MGLQNSNRIQRRCKGYIAPAGEQARPITGFYAEILKKPRSQVQPLTKTDPEPPPPEPLPKTQKEQTLEKARIVFGSKLAGPAERRKEIAEASQVIAGVTVPPKPTEPDNCCMSGCVNCVWDLYRDEMEEWAEKSAQARAAMQSQRQKGKGTGSMVAGPGQPTHVAVSMDDDGGGSETNWSADAEQAHLFDDIPVGIREFMRTEKKLKLVHQKEKQAHAATA
ncbi:Nn.00g089360.m01.CDS01 [Neocucurbitaria sp. VM-36]